MLNLVYTLPILTFFGLLVSAKDRHEVRGVVAGCIWVEYPYVKKCTLCITPEASCSDVQTGIVFLRWMCGSVGTPRTVGLIMTHIG